jgi:hypothetical protein
MNRDDQIADELERHDWTDVHATLIDVCTRFIRSQQALTKFRIASHTLLFRNGVRRGEIQVKYYPAGKNAYYRFGSVFEITHMQITPAGGDLIHRACLALMKDRALRLGAIRIEAILSDELLAKYVRKGWKVSNHYDNSPLLTREAYSTLQLHAHRITRAVRRMSRRNRSIN